MGIPQSVLEALRDMQDNNGFSLKHWHDKAISLSKENETLREIAKQNELEEKRLAAEKESIEKSLSEEKSAADQARNEVQRLKEDLRTRTHWPTKLEVAAIKEKLGYNVKYANIAITGARGCGKSSLINAFRGVRDNARDAAKTGVTETTLETTRYQDPNAHAPRDLIAWFDIPGAGTLKMPAWQYFNNQGLYIFDLIIVMPNESLSTIEIDILKHCIRFKIPTFIVWSKSDTHIANEMGRTLDPDYDDVDDLDEDSRAAHYKKCEADIISQRRKCVNSQLMLAGLPEQRVYNVHNKMARQVFARIAPIGPPPRYTPQNTNVTGSEQATTPNPPKPERFRTAIDEQELIRDIIKVIVERRGENHSSKKK